MSSWFRSVTDMLLAIPYMISRWSNLLNHKFEHSHVRDLPEPVSSPINLFCRTKWVMDLFSLVLIQKKSGAAF